MKTYIINFSESKKNSALKDHEAEGYETGYFLMDQNCKQFQIMVAHDDSLDENYYYIKLHETGYVHASTLGDLIEELCSTYDYAINTIANPFGIRFNK